MRKITKEVVAAFMLKSEKHIGNTYTRAGALYLHGNMIARWTDYDSRIEVSLAGWDTPTTKERLNGIPGVQFHTKNFTLYLNGKAIGTSEWRAIDPLQASEYDYQRLGILPLGQLKNEVPTADAINARLEAENRTRLANNGD